MLVMNVFPIAVPTALFSDALSCRFRLRPVTAIAAAGTPFAAGADEWTIDFRLTAPVAGLGALPRLVARHPGPSPITRGRLLAHRGRRPIERTPAPGTGSCEPLHHRGPTPLDRAARAD